MIKSVRLVNFFSFRDVEISLEESITVLVGINGSGKTNLLRALQLLWAGINGRLFAQMNKWGGFDSVFCHSKNDKELPEMIQLEFTLDYQKLQRFGYKFQQDVCYHIQLIKKGNSMDYYVNEKAKSTEGFIYLDLKNGNGVVFDNDSEAAVGKQKKGLKKVGDVFENLDSRELRLGQVDNAKRFPGVTALSKALHSLEVYPEFNTAEGSEMRRAMAPTGYAYLAPDGSNLFQVLNTISLNSTEAFDAIEQAMQEINPRFRRFRPIVYGSGVFEMQVQEDQLRKPTNAGHLSSGTLQYLCLLAILLNPAHMALVAIDEPERGLHPDMLLQLRQYLEAPEKQVIITTHSSNLLNLFPLQAIRVFEKDEFNQTQVKQFTEEQFAGWYDEFVPGQMWSNGDLGGNRY